MERTDRLRLHGSQVERSNPVTSGIQAIGCKGTVGMSKEVVDQNEPIETHGRAGKVSRSRDMLSALENLVGNLKEPVGDIKETFELVEGCTDGELKKQFYPQYAEKEAQAKLRHLMQQGIFREYVQAFSELMLQISHLSEKEAFYWFEDRLKLWAKHKLRRQGITELTIAMAKVKSFVELGLTKDKFESSKPNEKANGERNHEKDEEGHNDDGQ
ncbi:hypothetical protein Golob_002496 [Gossypium lobatum]|uniref:Retrotransposon gag domain-containing protein n=1 Tax=Gossypium lobatum TaxID=34289 RepID=A0A7J8N5F2_9ROSI|nr:hypothetical protein [Gossypium lobatum]